MHAPMNTVKCVSPTHTGWPCSLAVRKLHRLSGRSAQLTTQMHAPMNTLPRRIPRPQTSKIQRLRLGLPVSTTTTTITTMTETRTPHVWRGSWHGSGRLPSPSRNCVLGAAVLGLGRVAVIGLGREPGGKQYPNNHDEDHEDDDNVQHHQLQHQRRKRGGERQMAAGKRTL